MWLLRNDQKGEIFRVTPGKQHIVSRKDGDLVLLGDQSISRKHAELAVQNENGDEGIVLKDLGSKYGSFVTLGEGELTRLQQDQQVTLKDGDFVRFGSQWNSWRAEFVPLVVATSTLTQQEKAAVKAAVERLGGQLVSDWTEQCTHVTMNKLTVTVKVVCALAAGQPLVTTAYWRSLSEALSRLQSTLPAADSFLPPLAEAILNPGEVCFAPNPARAKLFDGLTFVAATARQTARIKPMIAAAGGNVVEFLSRSCSENQLTQRGFILMQYSPPERQGSQHSQAPDGYKRTARKMRAEGVRCVPESEIGLSVIYCSTEKFCNPRHNPCLLRQTPGSSRELTQLVPDACHSSESSVSSGNNMDCSENSLPNKRPLEDPNEDEVPPQKEARKEDSEDMFESQGSRTSRNPKSLRQTSLNFQRLNDGSGPSKPKTSNNPAPSLDMFAPSGDVQRSSRSATANADEPQVKTAAPSCEDIFASDKDLQSNRTPGDKNELPSKANEPLRNVTNEDDEFSFAPSKKPKRPRDVTAEENDEFSFVQTKKPSIKTADKNQLDEFSFTSTRKRNRPSDPDIFASSAENPGTESNSSVSKIRKTDTKHGSSSGSKLHTQHSNRNKDDNLFAFPNDQKLKKVSSNNSTVNVLDPGDKVKLAILSRKEESAPEQNGLKTNNEALTYVRPNRKDLVSYGKTISAQDHVKEEVKEEEVDALARELLDTTIVIVTSLLAKREKPEATQNNFSGKNFKKFQKVVGVNKRLIPKVIGGSDLVPYCETAGRSPSPPPLRILPKQNTPQDIWSFGNSKKRR